MTSKVSECQAETLQFMAIEKVSKNFLCTYCSFDSQTGFRAMTIVIYVIYLRSSNIIYKLLSFKNLFHITLASARAFVYVEEVL